MRITAFIFAFFYLINSVGYGLEIHYCLGRVSDVNHVLFDTFCPCDAAHETTGMNCCKERSFFNQIEDEHAVPASSEVNWVEVPILLPFLGESRLEDELLERHLFNHVERGPPILVDVCAMLVRRITYG